MVWFFVSQNREYLVYSTLIPKILFQNYPFFIFNKAMLRNWKIFVSQNGFKLEHPKTNVYKFLPLTLMGKDWSDFSEKVWMMFTVCNLFCLILQVFLLRYKTKMFFRFKFIFSVSDSVSGYRPPMNLRHGKAFSHVCQSLCSNVLNLVYLWTPPDPSPVRTPSSPGSPPPHWSVQSCSVGPHRTGIPPELAGKRAIGVQLKGLLCLVIVLQKKQT